MWDKVNGKYRIMNEFGEMVPAKRKRIKGYGISHETTCGQWVKKVVAVREGLKLTGKRRKDELYSWILVQA